MFAVVSCLLLLNEGFVLGLLYTCIGLVIVNDSIFCSCVITCLYVILVCDRFFWMVL